MYTSSNVRKFLNASNNLILESNDNVINKFTEMILEKYENIDRTELEQLSFKLKDDIKKDHLSNFFQKKKKRDCPKRPPSKYNLFIRDNMKTLKEDFPDLKHTELMIKAAALWRKEKETLEK
jgi:intein-encoded DNA endonuclease-like protein